VRSDFPWPFPRLFARLLGRYTRTRQVALLWVLATAIEDQLPLAPLVDAFSDDSRGPWRTRARDLAHLLRSGTPLPAALDALPGVLPKSAALAAHVGEQSGAMGPALRAEATALFDHEEIPAASLRGSVVYFVFLLWIVYSVAAWLLYYIVPKFKVIFQDFGFDPPGSASAIFVASDHLVRGSAIVGFFLMLLWIVAIWSIFFLSTGQLLSVGGLLSRVFRRLSIPGILRNLGVVIAAGRPVRAALSTLAAFHPVGSIRRRLLRVDAAVEEGAECWNALGAEGILSRGQVAILESAQRAGNLPWALRLLADMAEKRLGYRLQAVLEFVGPILVLALGVVVGLFVAGLFAPLIKLITELS
jgi:protein transport protein HofC